MKRVGVLFGAMAVASFCLGPLVWQFITSVRPENEITQLGLPSHITFASYAAAFHGRPFLRVILNSMMVASGTTLISLAVGGSAAFALARLEFRGRSLLLGLALAVSMFPPIATVSPLYLLLRALGLRNHAAGLILPYTTFSLPLTVWLLTSFFREIPEELYRAARVDGCTVFQAFRKVVLPLAGPGLASTGILVFVAAWNEFLYALTFLSSPTQQTIPVAISLFSAEHEEPWGEIAAASMIAMTPLIVMTVVFQRRIVAGLTAGAVKG